MQIKELLQKVQQNEISLQQAEQLLKYECEGDIGFAKIDYQRERRTGVPEVIYCAGKTTEQNCRIVEHMLAHGANRILGTRCTPEIYEAVNRVCPDMEFDEMARIMKYQIGEIPQNKGKVLVACAGTSDLPVAREAAVTAEFLGNQVIELYDVGVAGIHRLLSRIEILEAANVIIAVAGMEGALASVVGGLTDKPVIAVPTSVGYGANFHGVTALLAMLNSCASGVSVVNIDNGFGAGYMAHSINCLGGKE